MSSPKWEDGLRLDDKLGPARPLSDEGADHMVLTALDELAPPRRRIKAVRWGWALAAAAALFIIAPAAVAAFRTFILPALPAWRSNPAAPPRRASTPPPEVDLPADPEPEPPLGVEPDPPLVAPPPPAPTSPTKPAPKTRRRADRSVRPRPVPRSPIRTPRPTVAASADELLARAARLRGARAFDEATAAYAEVRRRYPGSGPAYVAAVAEGQLWLRPGGRPTKALAAFEAAAGVRPDGPLDAEILFGRGAALWALDRKRSARRAWRKLIDRYPTSAPARRAAARLKTEP